MRTPFSQKKNENTDMAIHTLINKKWVIVDLVIFQMK